MVRYFKESLIKLHLPSVKHLQEIMQYSGLRTGKVLPTLSLKRQGEEVTGTRRGERHGRMATTQEQWPLVPDHG